MSVHDLGEASAINDAASGVAGVIAVALVPVLIGLRQARANRCDAVAATRLLSTL